MSKCIICEGEKFDLVTTRIREGTGQIIRCCRCGLIMQDINWDKKRHRDYYENVYQKTNSLVSGVYLDARKHFESRLKTLNPLFEIIAPLLRKDMSILEIGCGAGALLYRIKPLVKRCVGVELNSTFVNFIGSALGIEAYCQDVCELSFEDKFDLVVIIDTLDHLPNPLKAMCKIKSLLSDEGCVYLEVPNRDEALNLYIPPPNNSAYQRFFWHNAHMFYFTRDTISKLFNKAGFSVRVTCRHNYTLKNFLNWYFKGEPQREFFEGLMDSKFFSDDSKFGSKMNSLLLEMEKEFKKIMSETFAGDTLCCVGEK